MTDNTNNLGKKLDIEKRRGEHIDTNKMTSLGKHMDDRYHTPEDIGCVITLDGGKMGL